MKNIQGIALIQVLIITMVLTLLGIFISQSVRNQVKLTIDIQASVKLELALASAEAQLIQALLTQKRYPNTSSNSQIVQRWNFYNKAFVLPNNVQVKMQDLNGLLSLNMMNHRLATGVFKQLDLEGHPVRTFLDSLKDWIDKDDLKYLNGAERHYYQSINATGPRNGYLQSIDEVFSIKMGDILPLNLWRKYFTEHTVGGFNPLLAPKLILDALIEDSAIVNEIVLAREKGELSPFRFFQLTGIDGDEYYNFATGRKIRVELRANSEYGQLSKHFVIELRPNNSLRTVIITNVSWNKE